MDIRFFETLESTNQYCKLLDLNKTEEFTVIWAQNQPQGKGQFGNRWESQPGQNLTFSIILHPHWLAVSNQFQLSKALSLGITDWLKSQLPKKSPIAIKWPNDIYVGNKKICGILIENHLSQKDFHCAICGIGININQATFSDWIPNPTSIKQILGKDLPLEQALHELLKCLQIRYMQAQHNEKQISSDYLELLFQRGEQHPYIYNGNRIEAIIKGVDTFGHLLLTDSHGHELVCSMKEIKFLICSASPSQSCMPQ